MISSYLPGITVSSKLGARQDALAVSGAFLSFILAERQTANRLCWQPIRLPSVKFSNSCQVVA